MRIIPERDFKYHKLPAEKISADHESLPPNIYALHAQEIEPAMLQRAFAACAAPVQFVQIEIPARPRALHSIWADYARKVPTRYNWTYQHEETPEHGFREWLETRIEAEEDRAALLTHFEGMISLARSSQKSLREISIHSGMVSNKEHFGFHQHGTNLQQPGWYFIDPLGEDEERSTFVLDARDLKDYRDVVPNFIRTPSALWHAKPDSLSVFTAGHHAQGNAFHSYAPGNKYHATIAVHLVDGPHPAQ